MVTVSWPLTAQKVPICRQTRVPYGPFRRVTGDGENRFPWSSNA